MNLPKSKKDASRSPVAKAAIPQSRWIAAFTATVFPFAVVGALMFLGVFFLYTPVADTLGAELPSRATFGNLTGLTLVLAGMTAAVRTPRVTQSKRWWFGAWLFFLAALAAYPILVFPRTQELINNALAFQPLPIVTFYGHTMTLPFVVLLITVVASVWSYKKPARGVWPLLGPGALGALAIVVRILRQDESDTEVWPIVLGSAAFLYLWWLATLLFDLSVVWHFYVRWSSAMDTMRQMIKTPEASPGVGR